MSNTDSLVTVALAIQKKLQDNTQLGFTDVFFGDQSLIPRVPAAAIEPVNIERELQGIATGGMTRNTLTVLIMVYHGLVQSEQTTRKECDAFAESVQAVLHSDLTLGGLIIHGYCANSESGVAIRAGASMRAHRITWVGISKTGLGL